VTSRRDAQAAGTEFINTKDWATLRVGDLACVTMVRVADF
jgi:hypothetical protein